MPNPDKARAKRKRSDAAKAEDAAASSAPALLSAPSASHAHGLAALPRRIVTSNKAHPGGKAVHRPAAAGPTTMTLVKLPSGKEYTAEVSGTIVPTVTTGRKTAPRPVSVSQAFLKHSGQDKGHGGALELGFSDIPANIFAQWHEWQSTGAWRRMETRALDAATKHMGVGKEGWEQSPPFKSVKPGGFLPFHVKADFERLTHHGMANPRGYHVTIGGKTEYLASQQDDTAMDKRLDKAEELWDDEPDDDVMSEPEDDAMSDDEDPADSEDDGPGRTIHDLPDEFLDDNEAYVDESEESGDRSKRRRKG